MARKPAKNWPAARSSASTCQAALGCPRPSAHPVRRASFHRTRSASGSHPRPVGPGPAGCSRRDAAITAQPRQHRAQNALPRGHWPASLRPPATPHTVRRRGPQRRAGVIEQGLECFHLEAHGGAYAWARQVDGRVDSPAAPKASGAGSRPRCGRAASRRAARPAVPPRRYPPRQGVAHRVMGRPMSSHQAAAAR